MNLNELLLSLGVVGLLTWGSVRLLGPFAVALAQRLRHQEPVAPDNRALDELRGELEALHERLDFVERALATARPHAPEALPNAAEERQSRATTPV